MCIRDSYQGAWCHVHEVVLRHECEWGISVLEHAVDDDVVLREEPGKGHPSVLRDRVTHIGCGPVAVVVDHPGGVDRRGHGGDATVGEDVDVVHAQRAERRHHTTGGRTEADDDGAKRPPVVTGGSCELHRVEHRAVAGQLVVLVEHVQVEGTVTVPVVHRLEGDQCEPLVDGELRQLLVLHAVRPPPEDLPGAQLG